MECSFCKIIEKQAEAYVIYESDNIEAFLDVDPINEGHVLIVPKIHEASVDKIPKDTLAEIMCLIQKIVTALYEIYDIDGYSIMQNGGDFCDFGLTAERLLEEAKILNNGAWIKHSYNVACLAEKIADRMELDSEKAYVLGLLHDIGRRNGNMEARHALEGYRFLMDVGLEEGARICMTHTFQYRDVEGIYDTWDCSNEEKQFIANYLKNIICDDYDKLIQLCDALSLANGYCFAEKKMVSSVIKFGFKDTTISKWKAILELKEYFDDKIDGNIYELF